MSDGRGGTGPAYFAIAAILLLFAVTALLRSSQEADQRYQPRPHHDATAQESAQVKPPVVIGLAPPETSPKTYDPQQYGEQADLIAQRWMAWSAVALLIVTTIGVILVAITVWQTRGVLNEAKRTTEAAIIGANAASESVKEARQASKFAKQSADISREAMLTTDRPWVKVDAEIIGPLIFDAESVSVKVRIVGTNIGKSPAVNLLHDCDIFPSLLEANEFAAERVRSRHAPIAAGTDFMNYGSSIFPDQKKDFEAELSMPIDQFILRVEKNKARAKDNPELGDWQTSRPAVVAGVKYMIPGDRIMRFTYMTLEISSANELHAGWTGAPSSDGAEDLLLQSRFFSGRIA